MFVLSNPINFVKMFSLTATLVTFTFLLFASINSNKLINIKNVDYRYLPDKSKSRTKVSTELSGI